MSTSGFVVENGVFKRYEGPEVEILEIPEGVTAINRGAFDASRESMKKCKKVIFPSSLKRVGDHLIRYNYDGWFDMLEELVFKGDIETIGEGAFRYIDSYGDKQLGKIGIKSIVFEGHVGCIEDGAFPRSRLTSVYAPKGIDRLGNWVFNGCMYLKEVIIPGLQSMGEECFLDCKKLNKLEIPESCKISKGTFTGCEGLANDDGQFVFNGTLFNTRNNRGWNSKDKRKWKSIPDGVTTIDDYAISTEDHFCVPAGVTTIKEQGYIYSPIGYAEDYFKTDKKLSGKGFLSLLENQWAKNLSAEDWAYIYLYQSGKTIDNILSANKKDANAVVEGLFVALNKYGKEKHFVRAAEYMIDNMDSISPESVQKMYNYAKNQKAKKAVELLKRFAGDEETESKAKKASAHPIEAFCEEQFIPHYLDKISKAARLTNKDFEGVLYKDSKKKVPVFVVKCATLPYVEQMGERPKHIGSYKTDWTSTSFVENADKVAAELDQETFISVLEKIANIKNGTDKPQRLIPLCRYGNREHIKAVISAMGKWDDWYTYATSGRSAIIVARGAIMLNESREAMMYAEKCKLLRVYAEMRNMDEDVLRDTKLADFGLDENGCKQFDLGSTIVEATVGQDLSIYLYDTKAQKIVKSLPKKGADAEKHAAASTELSDLKKNLKKVVKSRNDILFERFLDGKTQKASAWIGSYTTNPVLHRVAELIVWNQKKNTFILTKTGTIDCDGNPYLISDGTPIGVAHPKDMTKAEIAAWQKYFTSHGLKQPFEQIWEPVVDSKSIQSDRYKGCMIPFFRFKGREKHGIFIQDWDFHNQIDISFEGCDADVERIDWRRHEINMDDRFEIKSFSVGRNMTRKVNHIVAYLDRITVYSRILNDDVSVVGTLPMFTFAQIMEFINAASENNCTNVLAVLMDYKNRTFVDFDPMEEFSLDL